VTRVSKIYRVERGIILVEEVTRSLQPVFAIYPFVDEILHLGGKWIYEGGAPASEDKVGIAQYFRFVNFSASFPPIVPVVKK